MNNQNLKDLNQHTLREFKLFFETIKQLKAKPAVVTVHGFKGHKDAIATIEKSIKAYAKKFR